MAGARGKQRPRRHTARADPESARRSKRNREEARAVKPPTSMLSTPTLTVESGNHGPERLSLAYNLRNRKVFVPDDEIPGPPVYSKGEQIMHDTSSQTPACPEGTTETALEHYNRLNELDEHELVKAVYCTTFYFDGPWMHVKFLARLKGGTTCVELVPMYFFAELKWDLNKKGFSCVSCVKMDPADSETAPVCGCGICPSRRTLRCSESAFC